MTQLTLTAPQSATLAYIGERREVTRWTRRGGSIPMQRLVGLGLLRVVDTSYGDIKQTTWVITAAGKGWLSANEAWQAGSRYE